MNTTAIRSELHQLIDQLDDRFLKAVYAMVQTYQAEQPLGFSMDGKPIFASDLGDVLDKEVATAESGNYLTINELEKQSEQWANNIK